MRALALERDKDQQLALAERGVVPFELHNETWEEYRRVLDPDYAAPSEPVPKEVERLLAKEVERLLASRRAPHASDESDEDRHREAMELFLDPSRRRIGTAEFVDADYEWP